MEVNNETRQRLVWLMKNDTDLLMAANDLIFQHDSIGILRENTNAFFLIVMGLHVHMMQYGFACLEAGCVRAQSASNSMWKNCVSAFAAAIGFWLFGYAIAFGESIGGFVGSSYWAFETIDDINIWFYQYCFCATAATIMSGAIAERTQIATYTVVATLMSSFYYPFIVHWAWHDKGWLKLGGFYDFAGSGVVHLSGGAASLAAVLVVPPRRGRFFGKDREKFYGHSITLAALGCMILATGFICFNAGAQLHIDQPGDGHVIGIAAMNTMLAGAGGMIAVGIAVYLKDKTFPVMPLHCGLLAGNVSICAGCVVVESWAAVLTGVIAGLVYFGFTLFIEHNKLDDPVEAIAVHGGGGIAGLIAVAFLNTKTGIFYNWDARSGQLLGWQLCGAVVIAVWSFVFTFGIFYGMQKIGLLHAQSDFDDCISIDDSHGHEPAYPDTTKLQRRLSFYVLPPDVDELTVEKDLGNKNIDK